MSDFENAPMEQTTTVEVSGQEEAENLFKSLFPSGVQDAEPTEVAEETETINETEAIEEEAQEPTAPPTESDVHRELAELKQLFFAQNPQAQAQYLATQYGVAPAGLQPATVPQAPVASPPLQAQVPVDAFSVESLAKELGYDVEDLDEDTIQGLKVQSAMMQKVVNGALKPFFDEVLTPQRAELEQMKAREIESIQQSVSLNTFANLGTQVPAISQMADKASKGEQLSTNELAYLEQMHPIIELQKQQFVQSVLAQGYSPAQLNDLWKSPQFAKQAEQTISKNVAGIAGTLAKGLGLTASKGSIKGVVKSVSPTAVSRTNGKESAYNEALKNGDYNSAVSAFSSLLRGE
jgi:hypothetical protein